MSDNFGYYRVLGVDQSATSQDIKKAYRNLAKKYHPDVCDHPDCTVKFREITEAYEFLRDDKKREIYDTNYTGWGKFSRDESYSPSLDQIIVNLINSLNNPYSIMRNYAVEVLVLIGQPAFEPVLRATTSTDEVIRRKTCDILGRMGNQEAVPALIILLNDKDRFVRRRAAKALTHLNNQSAVVPLMNALHDPERKVRYRSAEALGKIGDKQAVPPLLNALNDPSRTVRRKVIIALGLIGSEEAVAPITWRLRDTSSQVRSAAEHVLKHQFNPSRPGMRKYRSRNKICPHCHKPVIPNTNYCPSCGASLS